MSLQMRLMFGLVLLMTAAAYVSAQELDAEPFVKTVRKIEILKTERTNPEMIRRRMRTKEGEVLDKDELIQDLHRIYEMGFYEDVKRQLIDKDDGYYITIVVKERQYIAGVSFEGNNAIRDRTLEKTIKTKAGSFLFEYNFRKRDIELIKERYIEKSYFNVEVVSRLTETDGGVVIVYAITENKPARIRQVVFVGNDTVPEYELKRVMKTDFYGFFPDRIYRENIFDDDIIRIRKYLEGKGFLENQVEYRVVFAEDENVPAIEEVMASSERVQYYGEGEYLIHLFVRIVEGPRYKIGAVNIVGNKEEIIPATKIREALRTLEGDDYSIETINADKDRIRKMYGDIGYAFARIRHDVKFDFDKKIVPLNFSIAEGKLYFIQDVEILGNTRTKLQVILREIEISKGERFNYSKLLGARLALNRLGLFRQVNITTRPGSGSDLVVIVVEVQEDNTGAFEVMLSYDERNKFAGTVKLMQKNFDVLGMWGGNFTGAAHELSLEYLGSPVNEQLSFSLKNPRIFDGKNSFSYRIADGTSLFNDYDEDSFNSYFSVGRQLFNGFHASIGLNIKNIEIFNVEATAPITILGEEGLSRIRSLRLSASYDRRQYYIPFFPSKGWYMGGGLEFAGDFLNANREYIEVSGRTGFYHTLHERSDGARQVLHISLRGKACNELGDETAVPLSERSWLGGIGSIRGFSWGSIGPYVGDVNIKGDAYAQMTIEYIYPLKWDPVHRKNLIHGIVFIDAGSVWNEAGDMVDAIETFEADDVRGSVGVGVRMYPGGMPIPVEFYWSWPYAKDGDDTRRFQIGIFGMPF